MYLNKLRKILIEKDEKYLFPCIKDLVSNGLKLERFSAEDKNIPSRQDVTQYIAAWFKYTGLSSEECREWMIEYCVGMLSAVSSSSKSKIRHSTKSNIKYIYKSDVAFNCKCDKNRFKASCESNCPVYKKMADKAKESEIINAVDSYEIIHRAADEIIPEKYSIKDKYKEQFEKAIEFAKHHIEQKISKKEIANLLNAGGFKTRTGKKWSYSILSIELNKLNKNSSKE